MKDIIDFLGIKNYRLEVEEYTSVYMWFRGVILDEIGETIYSRRTMKNDPILRKSGVYKLIKDGEVVYIGMSVNIINRLTNHVCDKAIDFNSIEFYTIDGVDKNGLLNIESRMIERFKPKYNIQKTENSAREWTKEIELNISI